jgi:hypothetical protein
MKESKQRFSSNRGVRNRMEGYERDPDLRHRFLLGRFFKFRKQSIFTMGTAAKARISIQSTNVLMFYD